MSVDGVVLVHGSNHGAGCWGPVVAHLAARSVAVDLPGRGDRPADFATVTLEDCVNTVIGCADDAGFERFVLVGHSLGGVTITETAWRHPERVAELIYVGAIVPAAGESAAIVMFGTDLSVEPGMPNEDRCRATMANDMSDEQWRAHWDTIVPEPAAIWNARLSGYPAGVPTTYVSMADDLGATPAMTKQMVGNLVGHVDHRVVQAAHLVMVTKPRELAAIINDVVAGR